MKSINTQGIIHFHIVILLVDFNHQQVSLEQYNDTLATTSLIASIPLSNIKNCYNIMVHTFPLMLTRQGDENKFEIIYLHRIQMDIGNNESFYFRKDDKLYFSAWFEDEGYREEVIVRDINTTCYLISVQCPCRSITIRLYARIRAYHRSNCMRGENNPIQYSRGSHVI
ncbi:MAG: hypothetical protein QM697_10620 [Lachnospiraceae bacterium]